jgi:hypothetical protein
MKLEQAFEACNTRDLAEAAALHVACRKFEKGKDQDIAIRISQLQEGS